MRSRPFHALLALGVAVWGCISTPSGFAGRTSAEAGEPAGTSRAPLRAAPAPSVAPFEPAVSTAQAAAGGELATPGRAPAPRASERELAPIQLLFELPYATGKRPRPAGDVAAASDDELVARWNMGGNGDPNYAANQPGFHPGARVVVDTKVIFPRLPSGRAGAKSKRLTQRRVLAQARSRGYWPFRSCYEAGLRERTDLSGETRIRITIGARGGVAAARLLGTELGVRSAAACLVRRARGLRFEPAPGRKVDVDLRIELWPGDAPLPEHSVSDLSLTKVLQQSIAAGLEARRPALESCYAAGLLRDPKLWGRLALGCELDAQGAIACPAERESQFPDKGVVDCVKQSLAELAVGQTESSAQFVVALRFGELPAPPAPQAVDAVTSGETGAAP